MVNLSFVPSESGFEYSVYGVSFSQSTILILDLSSGKASLIEGKFLLTVLRQFCVMFRSVNLESFLKEFFSDIVSIYMFLLLILSNHVVDVKLNESSCFIEWHVFWLGVNPSSRPVWWAPVKWNHIVSCAAIFADHVVVTGDASMTTFEIGARRAQCTWDDVQNGRIVVPVPHSG